MIKKRENRGITLIALVITIIILLILAGISISALTQTGLFGKAKQAKEKSEAAQNLENETLKDYESKVNEYLTGNGEEKTVTLSSKVEPGDYVTYTPTSANTDAILEELAEYSGNTDNTKNTASTLTQETELKWRVLDVVDGKVRLISEVPTTSTVTLKGYNGYNNAVYLLDKTCKTLYSKAGYSEKVQNLKIEDIQKYMTTTDYSTIDSNYGTTFSPVNDKKYPSIFEQEKYQTITGITQPETRLGLSEQTTPINQTAENIATSLTAKYTFWYKTMAESDFTNPIYYNLYIAKKNEDNTYSIYSKYWLSSRCISASSGSARFDVRRMGSGDVGAGLLYDSDDTPSSREYAIRPVITLKSNVLVKTGDGTLATPYEIGL